MEEKLFEQYYPLYSKIIHIAGLMPFDVSVRTKIRRIIYMVLYFCSLYFQFLNLRTVEKTQVYLIWMFSWITMLVLLGQRYVSFLLHKELTRRIFCQIVNDLNSFKDPVEIGIFRKCTKTAGWLVIAYIAVAVFLAIYTGLVLLLPTLLHAKKQLRYISMYGCIYTEQSLKVDINALVLTAVAIIGSLSVAGTESTAAVYTSYFCGLLEISRYRMDVAIQNSAKVDSSVLINIKPSLDMQRKALEFVSSFKYYSNISRGKKPSMELSKLYAKRVVPCP